MFISIFCLKSLSISSYTTCTGEETYDREATIRRNHALPFHCNDHCVGLQIHNEGTLDCSHTNLSELDIKVECPQTAGMNEGYCVF